MIFWKSLLISSKKCWICWKIVEQEMRYEGGVESLITSLQIRRKGRWSTIFDENDHLQRTCCSTSCWPQARKYSEEGIRSRSHKLKTWNLYLNSSKILLWKLTTLNVSQNIQLKYSFFPQNTTVSKQWCYMSVHTLWYIVANKDNQIKKRSNSYWLYGTISTYKWP